MIISDNRSSKFFNYCQRNISFKNKFDFVTLPHLSHFSFLVNLFSSIHLLIIYSNTIYSLYQFYQYLQLNILKSLHHISLAVPILKVLIFSDTYFHLKLLNISKAFRKHWQSF